MKTLYMSIDKRKSQKHIEFSLIIFLFFGVGCASNSPTEQIMRSDKPRAYKHGFLHGCESGHAKGGNSNYDLFLNKKRYKKGSQYWLGWRKGYKFCQSLYDSEGRKWDDYPIP